ncbi:hypothetical protein HHI36_014060 [Cryptolaemus montrouzieri]|uniref:Uncharacterized protein n=1 Tax=Cryptolaemus montrouzieri TaxID=559131 RepID=A0ABD2N1R1_9CUCU
MAIDRNVIKVIQLVLTIACLGLHLQSSTSDTTTEYISIGAFVGYLIILAGFFIAGPSASKKDVYYAIIGFALFAAASFLNFHKFYDDWNGDKKTIGLIKSGLALLNAVLFLLEGVLIWRD